MIAETINFIPEVGETTVSGYNHVIQSLAKQDRRYDGTALVQTRRPANNHRDVLDSPPFSRRVAFGVPASLLSPDRV